jgi:hypothetical protein
MVLRFTSDFDLKYPHLKNIRQAYAAEYEEVKEFAQSDYSQALN